MIVVAKSVKGHEYFYSPKTAHAVPKTSAKMICDALNRAKYQINENEVWHIHEVWSLDNAYAYAERQSFGRRNGNIYERR